MYPELVSEDLQRIAREHYEGHLLYAGTCQYCNWLRWVIRWP